MIDRIREGIGDVPLFAVVVVLSLFGVAMVYSAGQVDLPSPGVADLWKLQLLWLGVSLAAFLIVVRVQLRWFEWFAVPAYYVSILLLGLTLVIGTGSGTAQGVRSWIDLGPVSFQPSQFANLTTALMLARVMGNWRERPQTLAKLWSPVLIATVPMILILLQPDLGTAMVFGAMLIAALFWAGVPAGTIFMLISPLLALFLAFVNWVFAAYMVLLAGFLILYRTYLWEGAFVWVMNLASGAIAVPIWQSLEPYQRSRFLVFLDPSIDPRGAGWNVIQSQVAIGSGGLFGKGFTQGTQKRLAFLPEQHTDFIFSVIGEELGFILGTIPVLAAFAFIFWRMVRAAENSPDPFAGIVVFGIFGTWFTHVIVNIGMTVGVTPITGIPLPFVSYGGSFLLAVFIALGLVERIAFEQGRG